MVISRADGKARQIEENGLMLGLFPEAEYSSIEIPLSAGDRYLFCTDGVLEASNTAKEEFGRCGQHAIPRIEFRSPAKPFSDKLVDTLARWSGHLAGGAQEDDITMVVLDFSSSQAACMTALRRSPAQPRSQLSFDLSRLAVPLALRLCQLYGPRKSFHRCAS